MNYFIIYAPMLISFGLFIAPFIMTGLTSGWEQKYWYAATASLFIQFLTMITYNFAPADDEQEQARRSRKLFPMSMAKTCIIVVALCFDLFAGPLDNWSALIKINLIQFCMYCICIPVHSVSHWRDDHPWRYWALLMTLTIESILRLGCMTLLYQYIQSDDRNYLVGARIMFMSGYIILTAKLIIVVLLSLCFGQPDSKDPMEQLINEVKQ